MSPGMNNFFEEMLEAAKAREALPLVQRELDEARFTVETQAETIQRLQLKLMDRAAEIDALNAAVRQAEVSRDDAELRFLELDEKSDQVVALLDLIRNSAIKAHDTVRPPQPLSVPEVMAVQSPEPVQVGVSVPTDPTSTTTTSSDGSSSQHSDRPATESNPSPQTTAEGQSDAAPTAVTSDTPSGVALEAATPEVAGLIGEGSEGVSVQSDPTSPSATTGTTTLTADTNATDPDPVTYADEPGPKPDGFMDWECWYDWARRMDARYGAGKWPVRAA